MTSTLNLESITLKVIALDLEGTIISNAMSQIPRPGLFEFLQECRTICERIVLFTTVNESAARKIVRLLAEEGFAPTWFAGIEYVKWEGETKDLSFIPAADPKECVLIDDFHIYVHPGQEEQWIQIEQFDTPYREEDSELPRVIEILRGRKNKKDQC